MARPGREYHLAMHILIINFELNGIDRAQYEEACAEIAEAFAGIPGLVSKSGLANEETNTYGGVYVFENEQSLLDYKASELYAEVGANPAFKNFRVTDFEVLGDLSKITGVG